VEADESGLEFLIQVGNRISRGSLGVANNRMVEPMGERVRELRGPGRIEDHRDEDRSRTGQGIGGYS
jgi:hypothetical protein